MMSRFTIAPAALRRVIALSLAAAAAAVVAGAAGPAVHASTQEPRHQLGLVPAALTAQTSATNPRVVQEITAQSRSVAAPAVSHRVPLAAPALLAEPAVSSGGGCGFFDFGCQIGHAIDSWFAGLVTSAINPLFGLLGRTLLSTPQVGNFSTVRSLWTGSLVIADTCYVLLVLLGGILVMSHQTVQTSYAIKDIAPRLVVGFVAANLSLLVAGKAIAFANGMSAALAGQGLNPAAAGAMMRSLVERTLTESGMFFVLLALFAVLLVLALALIFVARLMLTIVLIAMAPLALACHALPQTEGFAWWWWRAFAGILAIESAQALVLVAAMRIFFTEGWSSLILGAAGGPPNVIFDVVQLICLLYILIRIPFWIYRRVWSSGGRSPAKSAVRYVFAAAVLRRVSPALSGGLDGRGRPRRGPGTSGPRPSGGRGPRGPRPGPAPGQRPRSPAGGTAGRPASGQGSGTHPAHIPPGAPAPAGGPGGSTGPGHGRPGGTAPQGGVPSGPRGPGRPSGPPRRQGPGRPGASVPGPAGRTGPRPPAPARAAKPGPAPQRKPQPSTAAAYPPRQPRPAPSARPPASSPRASRNPPDRRGGRP